MKKWISIVICCLFLFALPMTASASNSYVVDEAGLLSPEEAADLEQKCSQFYAASGMELVILTVDSLDGNTVMAYADDFFDANYGENGVILLIAMDEREWHISTAGTAIEAFDDVDLMGMEDGIMRYLPDGKYYNAFDQFTSDAGYYWNNEAVSDFEASLVIGLPVGFVVALITILVMRGTMNTKVSQLAAADYQVDGSYNLRKHHDMFLYSKVTKQAKPQQNNSSGTSVHKSSSGRSHGGRGGKF